MLGNAVHLVNGTLFSLAGELVRARFFQAPMFDRTSPCFLRLPKRNEVRSAEEQRPRFHSYSAGHVKSFRLNGPKTIRVSSVSLLSGQFVLVSGKKRRHHMCLLPDAPL